MSNREIRCIVFPLFNHKQQGGQWVAFPLFLPSVDRFQAICVKPQAGHSILLTAWAQWYQPPHCKGWREKGGGRCCFSYLCFILAAGRGLVLAKLITIVKCSQWWWDGKWVWGEEGQGKKNQVSKQGCRDQPQFQATWNKLADCVYGRGLHPLSSWSGSYGHFACSCCFFSARQTLQCSSMHLFLLRNHLY